MKFVLTPLIKAFEIDPAPYLAFAPLAAAIETSIAPMLLIGGRIRQLGVLIGVSLFSFNLCMLGPLGMNHNRVVWPWNVFMICSLVCLFIVRKPRSTTLTERFLPLVRRSRAAALLLLLVGFCPALFTVGLWDGYMSFNLYTGVKIDLELSLSHEFVARFPAVKGGWNDNRHWPTCRADRQLELRGIARANVSIETSVHGNSAKTV
jgi:hypothetical protein